MRLRIQIASVIRYYLPACVTEYSNYTFHDIVAKALEFCDTRAHQTTEDEKLIQFHLIGDLIICREEKNVPQKFKESFFYAREKTYIKCHPHQWFYESDINFNA